MQIVLDWIEKNGIENGIEVSHAQLDLLQTHMNMVLATNQVMNLTAITDKRDFQTKHIIDSLTILPYLGTVETVADIGSGAGFPGIVMGIMRPDIHVTLVDSLQKRVKFLQEVVDKLNLDNVTCIHSRGEDLAREGFVFDVTVARAVAKIDKLVKWIMPITAPGGRLLAMKGPDVAAEIEAAQKVMQKLNVGVKAVDIVDISAGERHSIVVIEK